MKQLIIIKSAILATGTERTERFHSNQHQAHTYIYWKIGTMLLVYASIVNQIYSPLKSTTCTDFIWRNYFDTIDETMTINSSMEYRYDSALVQSWRKKTLQSTYRMY